MAKISMWAALSLFILSPAFAALTVPTAVVAEATGADGARVFFTVRVEGGNDGGDGRPADTVTCTPSSGSLFPLGTTTVSCSGSEGSTGSFTVSVVDTTAPALSLPLDFTVVTGNPSGATVTYTATATDLVDGPVAVTCTAASGSAFPVGTTAVHCTATDSLGNSGTGAFNVTVVTSPPPPGNPDLVAEATGPDGARVTFNTGDEDDDGRPGSGGCSPAPGSTFPLGETTVTCPSGNFTVAVVDTTPPVLTLPGTIAATATGPSGAVVTFSATASDLVDGAVSVTCTPTSGSTFPLSTTNVQCSASDTRNNTSNAVFSVVVTTEPGPPPNPDDVTAEATGPAGAAVVFDAGLDERGRPITCTPASGALFPLGATTVTCSSGASFTVTVVDTTPPVLSIPSAMTVEASSSAGATVSFTATAHDVVDGTVAVTCTPPSGSTFALGTTNTACSATDARGNAASGSFDVSVVDTTPPAIASVTASPDSIWPPNKKLVRVTVSVESADAVDPAPLVRLYDITCDESIAPADASITDLLEADLRADRDAHADGRVYTLHVEAIDASGNRSVAAVHVTVPHDQSGSSGSSQAHKRRRSVGRR